MHKQIALCFSQRSHTFTSKLQKNDAVSAFKTDTPSSQVSQPSLATLGPQLLYLRLDMLQEALN